MLRSEILNHFITPIGNSTLASLREKLRPTCPPPAKPNSPAILIRLPETQNSLTASARRFSHTAKMPYISKPWEIQSLATQKLSMSAAYSKRRNYPLTWVGGQASYLPRWQAWALWWQSCTPCLRNRLLKEQRSLWIVTRMRSLLLQEGQRS